MDILWVEIILVFEEFKVVVEVFVLVDMLWCGIMSFDIVGCIMMGVIFIDLVNFVEGLLNVLVVFGVNCGIGFFDMLCMVLGFIV